jgi:hypothetical protein
MIRAAKFNYHKSTLLQLQHNSRKMWAHLNNLINSNTPCSIPIDANALNNYFTSVFNQAPKLQDGQSHSIPDSYFVSNSLFLATLANMSNSSSIGTDGLSPLILFFRNKTINM